jgi:electron transfer flavoprotein alpha subunit
MGNGPSSLDIFNIAHIGIVKDLHELLPVLIDKICAKKSTPF